MLLLAHKVYMALEYNPIITAMEITTVANHENIEPSRIQVLKESGVLVQNFESNFLNFLSIAMFTTPGILERKEKAQKLGIMI